MRKSSQLDKTFHIIIEQMIATGQAPHYTEIAAELGVSPRKAGRRSTSSSRPRFSGLALPEDRQHRVIRPFQQSSDDYRLTIDGVQKWFGQ